MPQTQLIKSGKEKKKEEEETAVKQSQSFSSCRYSGRTKYYTMKSLHTNEGDAPASKHRRTEGDFTVVIISNDAI